MFAGSFSGITQTVPLAIYDRFATDFPAALALSAVLVAVSAAILLSVKLVRGRRCLAAVLRVEARSPLARSTSRSRPWSPARCLALAGPSGAGKTRCSGSPRASCARTAGESSAASDVWLDTDAPHRSFRPSAGAADTCSRSYALFPASERDRQRRLSAARAAQSRNGGGMRLALLERFDVASSLMLARRTLSGGEQQSVALARALARRPAGAAARRAAVRARRSHPRTRSARAVPGPARGRSSHAARDPRLLRRPHSSATAVGVIDRGRVIQEGTASELAARPQLGVRRRLHRGGGADRSRPPRRERAHGGRPRRRRHSREHGPRVGSGCRQCLPLGDRDRAGRAEHGGSAHNRVTGEVTSLTVVGNRVRLGIEAGQELVAEVTQASAERFALRVGSRVTASWKAAATRLVPV